MKKVMTEKQYIKRMKQHQATFDRLWNKIAIETNDYIKSNPENKTAMDLKGVDHFADHLSLSGAWIYDRLSGLYPTSRGSLTKKIRKVLGFTYP